MTHFRAFIETAFRLLAERNIQYLVLRNYEDLPEKTTNDVDILIDPIAIKSARQTLLDSAEKTGWTLSNIGRFSCLSLFFFRPETLEQTHIDLMPGNRWHSLVFADDRKMLADRVPFKGFYIPTPSDEAWVGLATRLLYGGYVKEKYRPQIQSACQKQTDATQKSFGAFLGRKLAQEMVFRCGKGNWGYVEKLKWRVRFHVFIGNLWHPLSLFSRLLKDILRLASRHRFPPGLVVGIVGGDQTWRNAIAEVLTHGLQGTFYPEKTFRASGGSSTCSIVKKARKTSFGGGLFIIDYAALNGLEKHCDLLFSDGVRVTSGHVVPTAMENTAQFVTSTVLHFLENRTENRASRNSV